MSLPAPAHSPTAGREAEILAEGVREMYQVAASVAPFVPLFPLLQFAALWQRFEHLPLLVWCLAAVSVPLLRYVLVRRYRKQRPPAEQAARWANAMVFTALFDGVVWGIGGLLFMVPDSEPHQIFLLITITGASAILGSSYWPRLNYAYAVPAGSLTAVGLAWHGTNTTAAVAVALVIYLVVFHKMRQQGHQVHMRAIALHFENLDLVAQLRVQKDAAEQANVAKSKFLAAASHDLRQPLHALGLFTTALNERIRYPEVRSIVANINHCVAALGSLFEALLDVSRLDAGVVEPMRVHFALSTVLERLVVEYEPQARAKGLTFEITGGEQVLHSDPALVERILRNLFVNAIRYTPQGGVRVDAQGVGGQVEITVRDTGTGIPPDKREEIFREFVQLANPERDRTKGLGLGLAIVRRVATLLDGTVAVESEVGGGSLFRVRLPRGEPSAVAATVEEAPAFPARPFAGWLIVVIDDEHTVREAMQVLLDGWGCVAITAEDAAGAASALRAAGRLPDAIVADYRLREGATGAQAIDQLQAEFGAAIPAFIITGDTAPERLQEARASGYLLLHKPVQPGKLRAVLASLQRSAKGDR